MPDYITPDWPAPANVHAASTTRQGGVSKSSYDSFNLALHVEDEPVDVAANRRTLREDLSLPSEPFWLEQVHSAIAVEAGSEQRRADACWSSEAGQVCAVMTADCLPLLFCDRQGTRVAACHAGWRGLVNGVIPATVDCFEEAEDLLVWLGPAIGAAAFQVGKDVYDAVIALDAHHAAAFEQQDDEHWLCDIYRVARGVLENCGVSAVYGGDDCTHDDADRFFSYRRDGACGRMASLIWRDPEAC